MYAGRGGLCMDIISTLNENSEISERPRVNCVERYVKELSCCHVRFCPVW